MALPREIEGRWKTGVVLKRDPLSTVERGRFVTAEGEVEAVLRRIDEVPWWSFALARHLLARERRGRLFRIAAYEDLRHLLKHKARYAPAAIGAAERRVLARKSIFTRVWMATGKHVYQWVTRDILRFTDREGGGARLVYDAPRIAAHLKAHPQVREVAIVAYPDRRSGTGLYAFVEGGPALSERVLRDFMAGGDGTKPPEHLQVAEELPRRENGEIRSELLQL